MRESAASAPDNQTTNIAMENLTMTNRFALEFPPAAAPVASNSSEVIICEATTGRFAGIVCWRATCAKVMPGDELELLGFPELEELPRWLAQAAVRRLGLGKLPLGDIPVRFHPHHVTTR